MKGKNAMANYLLNLGVSTTPPVTNDGNFQADNSNSDPLLRSCVWLTGGAGLPPVQNNFYQISQALAKTDWSYVQGTATALPTNAGDVILVRVFQVSIQALPIPSVVLNAVFGQASGSETVSSLVLQSPLSVNGYPRTVIDSLQLAFAGNPQGAQQYWSTPSSDGACTFCLGEISGGNNTYTFNAGALVCTNPAAGTPVYQYGLDPRVKVGTGMRAKREKAA
jgi:hypothetical protein